MDASVTGFDRSTTSQTNRLVHTAIVSPTGHATISSTMIAGEHAGDDPQHPPGELVDRLHQRPGEGGERRGHLPRGMVDVPAVAQLEQPVERHRDRVGKGLGAPLPLHPSGQPPADGADQEQHRVEDHQRPERVPELVVGFQIDDALERIGEDQRRGNAVDEHAQDHAHQPRRSAGASMAARPPRRSAGSPRLVAFTSIALAGTRSQLRPSCSHTTGAAGATSTPDVAEAQPSPAAARSPHARARGRDQPRPTGRRRARPRTEARGCPERARTPAGRAPPPVIVAALVGQGLADAPPAHRRVAGRRAAAARPAARGDPRPGVRSSSPTRRPSAGTTSSAAD